MKETSFFDNALMMGKPQERKNDYGVLLFGGFCGTSGLLEKSCLWNNVLHEGGGGGGKRAFLQTIILLGQN